MINPDKAALIPFQCQQPINICLKTRRRDLRDLDMPALLTGCVNKWSDMLKPVTSFRGDQKKGGSPFDLKRIIIIIMIIIIIIHNMTPMTTTTTTGRRDTTI